MPCDPRESPTQEQAHSECQQFPVETHYCRAAPSRCQAEFTFSVVCILKKYLGPTFMKRFLAHMPRSPSFLSPYFPEYKAGITPIFEAQLSLVPPELVFYPSLDSGVNGGLYDIVESLLDSIFAVPSLVPRLSPHSDSPHYQVPNLQTSAFPPHLEELTKQ